MKGKFWKTASLLWLLTCSSLCTLFVDAAERGKLDTDEQTLHLTRHRAIDTALMGKKDSSSKNGKKGFMDKHRQHKRGGLRGGWKPKPHRPSPPPPNPNVIVFNGITYHRRSPPGFGSSPSTEYPSMSPSERTATPTTSEPTLSPSASPFSEETTLAPTTSEPTLSPSVLPSREGPRSTPVPTAAPSAPPSTGAPGLTPVPTLSPSASPSTGAPGSTPDPTSSPSASPSTGAPGTTPVPSLPPSTSSSISYDPADFVNIPREIIGSVERSPFVVTDMDGDGINDILVGACTQTGDVVSDIALHRGQGEERFATPIPIYRAAIDRCVSDGLGNGFQSLAVGDVNDDGNMDIVAAASYRTISGPNLIVLINTGGNSFDRIVLLDENEPLFNIARNVEVADMDGDGDLDIVAIFTVKSSNQGALVYFENDGSGRNFERQLVFEGQLEGQLGRSSVAAFSEYSVAAVSDMDNDGDMDVILLSQDKFQRNPILWAVENQISSGGGFVVNVLDPLANSALSIAVGDLTGNGRLDIVIGGIDLVEIYLNNGGLSFQKHQLLETPITPGLPYACITTSCKYNEVVVLDVDGDGLVDILSITGRSGVVWFPQVQNLIFLDQKKLIDIIQNALGGPAGPTEAMAVGDLNGDGISDIVVGVGRFVHGYFGRAR